MTNKRHRNLKISLGSFFGLVIIGGIVFVITQCLKATENLLIWLYRSILIQIQHLDI